MTTLFQRLSKIDEVSKQTIQGWLRLRKKSLSLKQIIPSLISSLIILYYHPDEIFIAKCSNNIKLSANKKSILQVMDKSSRDEQFRAFYVTCYGINEISLQQQYNYKYQWDIRINKCCQKFGQYKYDMRNFPIFIGIISSDICDANKCVFGHAKDGIQFVYGSDGEIFIDCGISKGSTYGESFGESDVISVYLDLQNMRINFALNGKDQGVVHRNINHLGNTSTKLRLSVTINSAKTSAEIINFVRHK